jgi:hypothetical protein
MQIDWCEIFNAVTKRGPSTLNWGLPEPWVQAELFREFSDRKDQTGWEPLIQEIPYLTYFPVQFPNEKKKNWKRDGAIKFIDLCLTSKSEKAFCWFELKVRHTGDPDREYEASKDALFAFKRDVGALIGFDRLGTCEVLRNPDEDTKAYWLEKMITPHLKAFDSSKHYFVSAYLQLWGKLNAELWSRDSVRNQIESWVKTRSKESEKDIGIPNIEHIEASGSIAGRHSLFISHW